MGILAGKVALITGASMGIGSGIAEVFAAEGAKLALAARSEQTDVLAAELKKRGAEVVAVKMDVTDPASVKAGVAQTLQAYGTIDILVNNAGVCQLEPFLQTTDAVRDFHFEVNVKGVWNVTREVVPLMQKKREGRIVILSSVTGDLVADPGEVAYATTKAALVGFTKSLAVELAADNITVNAICPGIILTPMVKGIAARSDPNDPAAVLQANARGIPLKRLGDPRDVGHLAAFLASAGASYITGTQMVIDGGSTLPESAGFGV
ncbi:MAG: SDR family oxidoreductase UcpA [Candidatus Margulisbacteria bacterium]|jgi:NAD(P)-dependent dehydrogenase (short-subunit alcohol dehydrogenase family)|nr:SDR family oxidoreductase UcpA [Candidatus Margulisiibacteriota bacterium]